MRAPALAAVGLLLPLLAGCTGPSTDADNDGLDDAEEPLGREIRVRTAQGTQVRQVTSDPAERDTDGDGLSDGDESVQGTDPGDPDTDADGLLDGPDLVLPQGTSLHARLVARGIAQHPGDGRFLGEEVLGTKPFDWDSDRPFPDGLSDGDEVRGWAVNTSRGSFRVASDPLVPDTDKDHLNDLEEMRRGCDPRSTDTDQDGTPDAVDADCARNVRLRVAVRDITLARGLDPTGDTDLLVVARVGAGMRNHTQALKVGPNPVDFQWFADPDDAGPHRALRVPVSVEFWDLDLAGDDPASGVQRQPLRLVGDTNVMVVEVEPFAPGSAEREASGTDGSVRFVLEPLLD